MLSDTPAGCRLARELMHEFAAATGLVGDASPRRYLWTDAFAVCNFLGLHRATGEGRYLDLALRLIDQVHHVLGRHRPDDPRRGWLSGLGEAEGERHPTIGGLRIGKELPERAPGEPYDPRLEWDRDGQYFHYLTQWMHALRRAGEETDQAVLHRWAVELARTAHARFTVADASGRRGIVWKASVDLTRPLVPSMGQHDALEAWLACLELAQGEAAAAAEPPGLEREIAAAAAMCSRARWETDDALGIGGLLLAVFRLACLVARHGVSDGGLLARLVAATRVSLDAYARHDLLALPDSSRLAFRELGLAIGLHALQRLARFQELPETLHEALPALSRHLSLAGRIDAHWGDPAQRASASWMAHREIGTVMLATSLAPGGYLGE